MEIIIGIYVPAPNLVCNFECINYLLMRDCLKCWTKVSLGTQIYLAEQLLWEQRGWVTVESVDGTLEELSPIWILIASEIVFLYFLASISWGQWLQGLC